MKLNYKRTLLVGLAFLSICAFWQLYDNVVPLILKNTFDIPDDIAGVIMALDNVLALFLLPLFGKLSDRTHTRLGRRMPYILGGTLAAVVLMNLLPMADRARSLGLFVAALGLLLLAMGVYRSPAVALMPDVTPKPLRSKGNAIINLMGTLGGVFTLAATSFLVTHDATGREDYSALFLAVSILMLAAVAVLLFTIRENRLAHEVELQNLAAQGEDAAQAQDDETPSSGAGFSSLDPALRRSLILILCSVALWFMGYNAVTTAFTKYVSVQWGYDIKAASQCLMVATVGAVVSYLPVGFLSSRFGRKRVIQAGVLLLAACFGAAALFASFSPVLYGIFALVGAAWAMINVNSYPMVVEISKSGDVGKYTGYYYTFSMAAQIVTPIASGWLLEHVGYYTLLPYAAVMVALSFVTISLTRHGDSRPQPPRSRLEAFDAGDD
ncbi:MAG TPA: MFS transporter [Candidatus Limiplasma pullistercoris]|nr:MFS transporter [Candidatus Limiplasma pullistercoris]